MAEKPKRNRVSLTTPRAKASEPEIRWWNRFTGLLIAVLVIAAFLLAALLARHDRSGAATIQAADWISRVPLAVGTAAMALACWWVHVQLIDFTRTGKWAWTWDVRQPTRWEFQKKAGEEYTRDLAGYTTFCQDNPVFTEDPIIRAAKTLGWSIYLGASLLAFCWVFAKAMGV